MESNRRSDVDLTADVVGELTRDPDVDERKIDVETIEGVVHLHGRVRSHQERRVADDDARAVPGVIDVENDLRVVPAERLSDEQLEAIVAARLVDNLRVEPRQLRVEVTGGRAKLCGQVRSADLRLIAEEVARWTPGVVDVENDLRVEPTPPPEPPESADCMTC